MQLSIGEAAAQCGVSIRTLRYYDKLGLVQPSSHSPAGYRFYNEAALARLQEVLFYRELELSLAEIAEILQRPDHDPSQALKNHRRLLELKRRRLDELLALVDATLEGTDMKPISNTQAELDSAKQQYAREARQRWGNTPAYAESQARAAQPGQAQQQQAADRAADEIFAAFAACRGQDPASPALRQLVERWQSHITQYHYTCTPEVLAGLGELYLQDARFAQHIDRAGAGTAQLMGQAIRAYCAR